MMDDDFGQLMVLLGRLVEAHERTSTAMEELVKFFSNMQELEERTVKLEKSVRDIRGTVFPFEESGDDST